MGTCVCGASFAGSPCYNCGRREPAVACQQCECCAAKDARIDSLTDELRQVHAALAEKVERAGTLAADLREARERIASLTEQYIQAKECEAVMRKERDEAVKREGALREAVGRIAAHHVTDSAGYAMTAIARAALKEGEGDIPMNPDIAKS